MRNSTKLQSRFVAIPKNGSQILQNIRLQQKFWISVKFALHISLCFVNLCVHQIALSWKTLCLETAAMHDWISLTSMLQMLQILWQSTHERAEQFGSHQEVWLALKQIKSDHSSCKQKMHFHVHNVNFSNFANCCSARSVAEVIRPFPMGMQWDLQLMQCKFHERKDWKLLLIALSGFLAQTGHCSSPFCAWSTALIVRQHHRNWHASQLACTWLIVLHIASWITSMIHHPHVGLICDLSGSTTKICVSPLLAWFTGRGINCISLPHEEWLNKRFQCTPQKWLSQNMHGIFLLRNLLKGVCLLEKGCASVLLQCASPQNNNEDSSFFSPSLKDAPRWIFVVSLPPPLLPQSVPYQSQSPKEILRLVF